MSLPRTKDGRLSGHLDGLFDGSLLGWVLTPPECSEKLSVVLEQNGEIVQSVVADQLRQDLEDIGIEDGMHGFHMPAPKELWGSNDITFRLLTHPIPSIIADDIDLRALTAQYDVSTKITHENSKLPICYGVGGWKRKGDKVLIVGSAPTIAQHKDLIRKFQGEIWALNDSIAFLREIHRTPDRIFVGDTRFLMKRTDMLQKIQSDEIIVLSTVDTSSLKRVRGTIRVLQSFGRDGFSDDGKKFYHGCSVFFLAAQCAVACQYRAISTVGVLFSLPSMYHRIDNSSGTPEYVHHIQLKNAQLAVKRIRERGLFLEVTEPHSNLNFV